MIEPLLVVAGAVGGAVVGSLLACVPALHVYNVLGFAVLGVHALGASGTELPAALLVSVAAGLIVGFAMLNTVPSILLAAPDESALFTVLPGQQYLMRGRGYEATMITAAGGLGGLLFVTVVLGPAAPRILPFVWTVLRPHMHWILWAVICFMLMSEWPRGGVMGQGGWLRLGEGWSSIGAGLLTFLLSGLLGFLLFYRAPVPATAAFQSMMPAFVGLFAMPWLIFNIISSVRVPPQHIPCSLDVSEQVLMKGIGAGALGGGFAAFVPAVTGGVGGFLAGHATAQRDERVFLVSQGASKLVYYVGAFVLFFVPGLHMTRGGGAWLMRGILTPRTFHDYFSVLAAVALAGATALLLVGPLARVAIVALAKIDYRRISLGAFGLIVVLVLMMTGWPGLAIAAVATGIGLIPVLFNSRRMNCLGVILLPVACNMSGVGAEIARFLGLT